MEKRTITKRELCERIAKETGLTQVAVKASVQAFLDAIIEELSAGNRLEFRDFGVFDTRIQASRKARNPRTGDEVQVPAKAIAYFKIGKKMEDIVQDALSRQIEEAEEQGRAKAAPAPASADPASGSVSDARAAAPGSGGNPSGGDAGDP